MHVMFIIIIIIIGFYYHSGGDLHQSKSTGDVHGLDLTLITGP